MVLLGWLGSRLGLGLVSGAAGLAAGGVCLLADPGAACAGEPRAVPVVDAGSRGWQVGARAALEGEGFCHVRRLVPPKAVAAWAREGVQGAFGRCQSLLSGARRALQVRHGRRMVLEGPLPGQRCGDFVQGSRGRFHWMPEEDDALLGLIREHERAWMPLVASFMLGSEAAARHGLVQDDIYLSEAQLLVSVPGSEEQPWHSDNDAAGITIVVPLVPMQREHGPTQLLPGSESWAWWAPHYRVVQLLGPLISVLAEQAGPWEETLTKAVAPAGTALGDAVAFDARLLHRGLGNSTGEDRPCVIIRYDFRQLRAPGR